MALKCLIDKRVMPLVMVVIVDSFQIKAFLIDSSIKHVRYST